MGKRGTKPKPLPLRKLHGTEKTKAGEGHKRDVSETPQPTQGEIIAPTWLPDEAVAIFQDRSPELIRLGLLTETDVPAFAQCVFYLSESIRLSAKVAEQGDLLPTGDSWKANPLVGQRNQASALFHKFAMKFGLTPSDRIGLQTGSGDSAEDEGIFNPPENVVPMKRSK